LTRASCGCADRERFSTWKLPRGETDVCGVVVGDGMARALRKVAARRMLIQLGWRKRPSASTPDCPGCVGTQYLRGGRRSRWAGQGRWHGEVHAASYLSPPPKHKPRVVRRHASGPAPWEGACWAQIETQQIRGACAPLGTWIRWSARGFASIKALLLGKEGTGNRILIRWAGERLDEAGGAVFWLDLAIRRSCARDTLPQVHHRLHGSADFLSACSSGCDGLVGRAASYRDHPNKEKPTAARCRTPRFAGGGTCGGN